MLTLSRLIEAVRACPEKTDSWQLADGPHQVAHFLNFRPGEPYSPFKRIDTCPFSYKVCDAVDNDASAIHKATKNQCDPILLHLMTPLQDSPVTVSVLRDKLPHVKIVGFSSLSRAFVAIATDPGKSRDRPAGC